MSSNDSFGGSAIREAAEEQEQQDLDDDQVDDPFGGSAIREVAEEQEEQDGGGGRPPDPHGGSAIREAAREQEEQRDETPPDTDAGAETDDPPNASTETDDRQQPSDDEGRVPGAGLLDRPDLGPGSAVERVRAARRRAREEARRLRGETADIFRRPEDFDVRDVFGGSAIREAARRNRPGDVPPEMDMSGVDEQVQDAFEQTEGRREPTSSEERRAKNQLVERSPLIDEGDVVFVERDGQVVATVDEETAELLGRVGFQQGEEFIVEGGRVGETGAGEDLPVASGGRVEAPGVVEGGLVGETEGGEDLGAQGGVAPGAGVVPTEQQSELESQLEAAIEEETGTEVDLDPKTDIVFTETDGRVSATLSEAGQKTVIVETDPTVEAVEGTPLERVFKTGRGIGVDIETFAEENREALFDARDEVLEEALDAVGDVDVIQDVVDAVDAATPDVDDPLVSAPVDAAESVGAEVTAAVDAATPDVDDPLVARPVEAGETVGEQVVTAVDRAFPGPDDPLVRDPVDAAEQLVDVEPEDLFAGAAAAAPLAVAEPTPAGEVIVGGAVLAGGVLVAAEALDRDPVEARAIAALEAQGPLDVFEPELGQTPPDRMFVDELTIGPTSLDLPELLPPTAAADQLSRGRFTPPEIEIDTEQTRDPFGGPEVEVDTDAPAEPFGGPEVEVPAVETAPPGQQQTVIERTEEALERGREAAEPELITEGEIIILPDFDEGGAMGITVGPNPRSFELRQIDTGAGIIELDAELTRVLDAQVLDEAVDVSGRTADAAAEQPVQDPRAAGVHQPVDAGVTDAFDDLQVPDLDLDLDLPALLEPSFETPSITEPVVPGFGTPTINVFEDTFVNPTIDVPFRPGRGLRLKFPEFDFDPLEPSTLEADVGVKTAVFEVDVPSVVAFERRFGRVFDGGRLDPDGLDRVEAGGPRSGRRRGGRRALDVLPVDAPVAAGRSRGRASVDVPRVEAPGVDAADLDIELDDVDLDLDDIDPFD